MYNITVEKFYTVVTGIISFPNALEMKKHNPTNI